MKETEASSLSIRTVLWFSLVLVIVIARIVMDIIALASGTFDSSAAVMLRFVFGFGLIISSALLIWSYAQTHTYRNRLDFFSEFSRLIVALFISILPIGAGGRPESIPSVVIDNLFMSVRIFTTLYTVAFLYRAITLQRTSQTQRFTRVILFGTVIAFSTAFLAAITNEKDLHVIILLLGIFLAVIMYIAVKRRTWVLLLAASEKRRLLLLVSVGLVVSSIAAITASNADTELHQALSQSTYGFFVVMSYAGVFLAIFCERVFWTILFSLPNSSMVERRNFEFSSVAYLNRIAAESTDIQKLYSTVTMLAHQATRASSGWCFICAEDNPFQVVAKERITDQQIEALNDSGVLLNLASGLQQPLNIEFITEHPTFGFLSRSVESFAQSMIIAPLRSGKDMVGAVVVLHSQPFSFESDDVEAIAAFASSASVALENARLVEDSLEKERYHRELLVGREIQRKLLPQSNPRVSGYDIHSLSDAALEVGGDYYDFFQLADGKPCILIADVSGKGISAAFYMAKLKGVSLALARHATSALDLVKNINATLFGTMERQMYITLTALHISEDGKISLVRAGHTPALLLNSNSTEVIKPKGLGIGLAKPSFFETCIEAQDFFIPENATLLLFTDGINEARNPEGDEFGLERLEYSLRESHSEQIHDAHEMATVIMDDVSRFAQHSLQHDDMTLIVIRRTSGVTTHHNAQQLTTSITEEVERQ